MTIHPLGCDKHGWKMTSRSSVEGQWSVSAVSRSIREQRKFTKKKPEGSSGFFVTGHVLPCKSGRMSNGILKLGYKLAWMKFIYLFLLRFSWRNSLLLLIRSSIWPCDKYSINSWNISSALHGLISHTTRACLAYTRVSQRWQWSGEVKILSIHFP